MPDGLPGYLQLSLPEQKRWPEGTACLSPVLDVHGNSTHTQSVLSEASKGLPSTIGGLVEDL